MEFSRSLIYRGARFFVPANLFSFLPRPYLRRYSAHAPAKSCFLLSLTPPPLAFFLSAPSLFPKPWVDELHTTVDGATAKRLLPLGTLINFHVRHLYESQIWRVFLLSPGYVQPDYMYTLRVYVRMYVYTHVHGYAALCIRSTDDDSVGEILLDGALRINIGRGVEVIRYWRGRLQINCKFELCNTNFHGWE